MTALTNKNGSSIAADKLTTAQIQMACPARLQELGRHIAAHYDKARKSQDKADQHYAAAAQYLAEAREACDDGGFNAFREKFCPQLGQSRAYELLQIATSKKSLEEIRADTRKRVAKHQANKHRDSVTVTESPEPQVGDDPISETERLSSASRTRDAAAGAEKLTSGASEQTPEPVGAMPISSRDELVCDFSATVTSLLRIVKNREAKHFANTAVPADDLERLGQFFTELASAKKCPASEPIIAIGNAEVSAEQSAEDMKAKHAALEAVADLAA